MKVPSEYERYLCLPELLALQQPATPPHEAFTHSAEHFFIVVHQATELFLGQAVLDLATAAEVLASDDADASPALPALRRAVAIMALLREHLRLLRVCGAKTSRASGRDSSRPAASSRARLRSFSTSWASPGVRARWSAPCRRRRIGHRSVLVREATELLTHLASAMWGWQTAHIELPSV